MVDTDEKEVKETKEAPKLKVEEVEESTKLPSEDIVEKDTVKESDEKVAEETIEPTETIVDNEEGKEVKSENDEEKKDVEEVKEKSDKIIISKRFLLITLFTAAFVSLLVGGILRFRSGVPQLVKPSPTASIQSAEPIETASPVDETTLADYAIQVLNGSGVAGRAGDVADQLKVVGFEGVETGNAKTYDYTDTEVQLKKDVPSEVFDVVKKALSGFTVIKGDELEESSDYDIVVIVGEKG